MSKSNLIQRSITGAIFVVVLVGAILLSEISFTLLFTLISAMAVMEFTKLMNTTQGTSIKVAMTSLSAAYLSVAFAAYCYNAVDSKVFIPYLFLLLNILISELYRKKDTPILNWAYAMFGQLYIALPFALLSVLAFSDNGVSIEYNPILPLSVFVFIWINDTGAYCVGSLIGKHRLFERISPKKSWEGSIGGAVFAIIAAVVFSQFYSFLSVLEWIGLAITIVVFATWGDLTESLLKRQLNIKDSGSILPGHGGLLDRFDSALMAIPAAIIYLMLIKMI